MRLPQFNQDSASVNAAASATLTARVAKAGRLLGVSFAGSINTLMSCTSLLVGSEVVVPNGDAVPVTAWQPDGTGGAFLDLSAFGWRMKIAETVVAVVTNNHSATQTLAICAVISPED